MSQYKEQERAAANLTHLRRPALSLPVLPQSNLGIERSSPHPVPTPMYHTIHRGALHSASGWAGLGVGLWIVKVQSLPGPKYPD